MSTTLVRIGIAGCGSAARIHVERLLAHPEVEIVGLADVDESAARKLAEKASIARSGRDVPVFRDHLELLKRAKPDALAIFTPHFWHYKLAMDGLQFGCHLFIEKPLSTDVQEAADIVNLAEARGRKVAVGHQYRLLPSLATARAKLAEGAIGRLLLVSATLAQPWLATHQNAENSWRFDPKVSGGGILADSGDHLVDALIWATGRVGVEVASFQSRLDSGLDVVTASAIRLSDGTPATLALSGDSADSFFGLTFFGDRGRLRVTDRGLTEEREASKSIDLPPPDRTIDGDFVSALTKGTPLCCPGSEALETVRLLEAMARSAMTGRMVKVS